MPSIDFPDATLPVIPMIELDGNENEISDINGSSFSFRIVTLSNDILKSEFTENVSSLSPFFSSAPFMIGSILFHETSAFWTALNKFAAWEDFFASFEKHEKNAVNAAISQAVQPVPITFFPPKIRIGMTPSIEITRYIG